MRVLYPSCVCLQIDALHRRPKLVPREFAASTRLRSLAAPPRQAKCTRQSQQP